MLTGGDKLQAAHASRMEAADLPRRDFNPCTSMWPYNLVRKSPGPTRPSSCEGRHSVAAALYLSIVPVHQGTPLPPPAAAEARSTPSFCVVDRSVPSRKTTSSWLPYGWLLLLLHVHYVPLA